MKIFSKEHTLKTKSEHCLYIGSIVYGAGGPFAFSKTYDHYKPCLKGGHTHNHFYNVCHKHIFRSKDGRNKFFKTFLNKKSCIKTFYKQIQNPKCRLSLIKTIFKNSHFKNHEKLKQ